MLNHYIEPSDYLGQDDEPVIYSSQLSHIREHFAGVLSHLYGKSTLNTDLLEFSLDELAYALGVELPDNDLTVERQHETIYCAMGYASNF